MWKFIHSIPRAFRQYVHSPRPSAGLYVEEEQEVLETAEKSDKFCPFTWITKGSKDRNAGEKLSCSSEVLNSLSVENGESRKNKRCNLGEGQSDNNTGSKDRREWWQSCQYDIWRLIQGSHRMAEAVSLGSAVLWGSEIDRFRRKSRLLHRVLFALPGSGGSTISCINSASARIVPIATPQESQLLAIKDAAGSAQDAEINKTKSETLDSALQEFQTMCEEYTAFNESILGLQAVNQGDMSTAVEHLRRSCLLGNTSACFNLGLCYETGSGVSQDLEKAEHYYNIAAKAGHSMALFNLGLMYLKEKEDDEETRAVWAWKREEGINLLDKAARLGLPEALLYLGVHHIQEKQDPVKAVPYFKAAADQNDTEAQYFLAMCYEQGWGVEVNECKAAHLYSVAASAGHEAALYNLAVFNEYGLGGLPEDSVAAVNLYEKSAQLGYEQAKHRLEEISEASKPKLPDNTETFHQLNIEQIGDATTHHHSSVLSPSASSPNLSDYFHRQVSSFFSFTSTEGMWGDKNNPSFGSDLQENKPIFHLGSYNHEDLPEPSFGSRNLYEKIDRDALCSKELHRSRTYPSIALAAL
ncbi:uncharacterized protein LOC131954993 [Physella acuta]|uniref:uncharacterized protein LOC131954993 n=1 Tax=Physella acuta TaxID=109671 RepID=UPI0027DB7E15|nr:uncharacterized protein LOC131954993 [Physella acuta]